MSGKRLGEILASAPARVEHEPIRLRLTPDGFEALRRYAAHLGGVMLEDAAHALFYAGLRAHERARKAGQARAASRSPDEQRAAVAARWRKVQTRGKPRV